MPKNGSRLTEKLKKLSQEVDENPHLLETWKKIILEIQVLGIEEARPFYEKFFERFPQAGDYWKLYSDHELKEENNSEAERIFKRSLLSSYSVELWHSYICYVRDVKKAEREDIRKAFEYTLSIVGYDISANIIYRDYIDFVLNTPILANNKYEEGNKINMLRNLYQRAVVVPMYKIDNFWKEYEKYETDLNADIAKGIISEYHPKFAAVKSIFAKRKALYKKVDRSGLVAPFRGSESEQKQLSYWRDIIDFEKGNPLLLGEEEFMKKVKYVYNNAMVSLCKYPGIWEEAAKYFLGEKMENVALDLFKRGIEANPMSIHLKFAYLDFLEKLEKHEEVEEEYNKLTEKAKAEISDRGGEFLTLIHIQHMKFIRRTKGVRECRAVFSRAEKSGLCTYQLFTAAALMEFFANKDPRTAKRIFALGLKVHGREPAFILAYMQFLLSCGDLNEFRVIFQRSLENHPENLAMWNAFLGMEYFFSDIKHTETLEKKRAEAFTDLDPSRLATLITRYSFGDLVVYSSEEEKLYGGLLRSKYVSPEERANQRKRFIPEVKNVVQLDQLQLRDIRPEDNRELSMTFNSLVMDRVPRKIVDFIRGLPPTEKFASIPCDGAEEILSSLREVGLPLPGHGGSHESAPVAEGRDYSRKRRHRRTDEESFHKKRR